MLSLSYRSRRRVFRVQSILVTTPTCWTSGRSTNKRIDFTVDRVYRCFLPIFIECVGAVILYANELSTPWPIYIYKKKKKIQPFLSSQFYAGRYIRFQFSISRFVSLTSSLPRSPYLVQWKIKGQLVGDPGNFERKTAFRHKTPANKNRCYLNSQI